MKQAVEERGETGMRTFAALSAAALAALTPSMAWAEANWVYVSSGNSGTTTVSHYIDTTSIRHTGSMVRYWEKYVYVNDKDGWEQTKTLQESDCENGRNRRLQATIYFVDGRIETHNNPTDWRYVTPGTIGEALHEAACQK